MLGNKIIIGWYFDINKPVFVCSGVVVPSEKILTVYQLLLMVGEKTFYSSKIWSDFEDCPKYKIIEGMKDHEHFSSLHSVSRKSCLKSPKRELSFGPNFYASYVFFAGWSHCDLRHLISCHNHHGNHCL